MSHPLDALFELFSRKWTLRIVWELRDGPLRFRQLRTACDDLSPTTLTRRLADLTEAGIVAPHPKGYTLTQAGAELLRLADPLREWVDKWG